MGQNSNLIAERLRVNILKRVNSIVITGLHGYAPDGNRQGFAVSHGVVIRVAEGLRHLADLIENDGKVVDN